MSTSATSPRRLLPLILSLTGMGVLAFSVILPALPDLADELGVSRASIGLVQGAVAIPGIFLAAYIGYLADRHGRRAVIRVSLLVFGTAGLACFFARSYWLLVGLRAVQGLGTSALLGLGVVVIGDLFAGHERRWAMGINLAALTTVTTLAPIIGGLLAEGGAFRPFLVFTVAFPMWIWAGRLPGRPDAPPLEPPFRHARGALTLLRERGRLSDYLGTLPVSFITLGVFAGLGLTVTPLFLEGEFGLSAARRGMVQAIGSAASSVASLSSGRVGRRWPPARVFNVSFLMMVIGFAVLAAAPSLWVLGIGLAALGLGTGSIFPILQDYSAAAGPTEYRGVLVGGWVSANRLGQWLGPTTGTALVGAIGERKTYMAGAVVIAVMAAVWRPLRRGARLLLRRAGPEGGS